MQFGNLLATGLYYLPVCSNLTIWINNKAATTNNFIAVNILLKNRTFLVHFRNGPLQEHSIISTVKYI